VGEAVDSVLFYPLAFYGVWSNELLLSVLVANYCLKVSWEVLATPLTVRVVGWLKKKEGIDVYDTDTNFTPFFPSRCDLRPCRGRQTWGRRQLDRKR
jgi:hypothetical protein